MRLLLLPLCPILCRLCLRLLLPLLTLARELGLFSLLHPNHTNEYKYAHKPLHGWRTCFVSSSINFSRSYSLRLLALYTWNSPEPAPALEPCTFFIIALAGLTVFSFGGGGMYAGFAGSLSSFSSCAFCRSTGVAACLFIGGVPEPEGAGD